MDAWTYRVQLAEVPGLNGWEGRIRILFDLDKWLEETLANACRVLENTSSSIQMAVASEPSVRQHECGFHRGSEVIVSVLQPYQAWG